MDANNCIMFAVVLWLLAFALAGVRFERNDGDFFRKRAPFGFSLHKQRLFSAGSFRSMRIFGFWWRLFHEPNNWVLLRSQFFCPLLLIFTTRTIIFLLVAPIIHRLPQDKREPRNQDTRLHDRLSQWLMADGLLFQSSNSEYQEETKQKNKGRQRTKLSSRLKIDNNQYSNSEYRIVEYIMRPAIINNNYWPARHFVLRIGCEECLPKRKQLVGRKKIKTNIAARVYYYFAQRNSNLLLLRCLRSQLLIFREKGLHVWSLDSEK